MRATVLASMLVFISYGQPKPNFETAIVKLDRTTGEVWTGCRLGPGNLEYMCRGSIPWIVAVAYNLSPDQVSGTRALGPQARYAIIAKLSAPMGDTQRRAALRSFLATDLGLVTHSETRELIGYFITEENPQLAARAAASNDRVPAQPVILPNSTPSDLNIKLAGASIQELAHFLSRYYGVVIDQSNDLRRFDFSFTIHMPSPEDPERERLDSSDLSRKLKNLGFGVRQRKGPVEFLAIDKLAPEDDFLGK